MKKNVALILLVLIYLLSCSTDEPTDTSELQVELGQIRNQLKVLERINSQNQVSKNQEQFKIFERLVNQGHAAEVEKLQQEIAELKKQLQQQNIQPIPINNMDDNRRIDYPLPIVSDLRFHRFWSFSSRQHSKK